VGDGARSNEVDQPDVADVVAAASGDPAAFDRLVRTMQGRVWRYIVHIVGDHSLAEDLAQEVFLRMHRKLHTLRDPNRFVSWLLSMARNAAYDAGRSRRRRPLHLLGDDVLPETAPSSDPHMRFEVFEAIQSLDDELREAVVLVAVTGFSYQEAAGAIGIPEGTVKSRVFRGRKQLIILLGLDVADVD
jgi:RNA polymerase sigma-70 factor (ECF subfamily)